VFCLRNTQSGVGDASSLWLEREPSLDEIMAALDASCPFDGIDEIVFCGYGEPMERADVVIEISNYIKTNLSSINKPALPVRINTNGLVFLMHPGFDVSQLAIVDTVSISLNADDSALYQQMSRPRFGEPSFDALLSFAREAKAFTSVVLSVVEGTISPERLDNCRCIASEMGVALRVRPAE